MDLRQAGLAIALFLAARAANAQQAPPAAAADAFAEADLEFRTLYAGGRAATLAGFGPVIVAERDELVLIHKGKRAEATAIPPVYHRLKAASHVPLAIYVTLAPYGDKPLDQGRRDALARFNTRIAAVLGALDQAGFSEPQAARCRTLLERCVGFLEPVLSSGHYDPSALRALTRFAGPIVMANVSDAARAQIDGYHACIKSWRKSMPAEEWANLRVVVMGPQMQRKQVVAVQYFTKLMGLPGESRRLVYAEELAGQQQALNLLATHQLDSELSRAFFDNPERMEIDLLGNAAATYLDTFEVDR